MRLIDADNIKIPNDAEYKASVKRVIEIQPTVNEWTLCSIKMPDVSDWYMVSLKDAEMEIMAHYIKTTNKFEDRDYFGEMVEVQNVVAWRQRQPAVKEESE